MSKVLNVKLLNSNGGYLESIPDYLMERLLAKLLFVHESYKNGDGSLGLVLWLSKWNFEVIHSILSSQMILK